MWMAKHGPRNCPQEGLVPRMAAAEASDLPAQVLGRLLNLAPVLAAWSERGTREYGLSYARGRVVGMLRASGPVMMRTLSTTLGVTPTTVTGLVDALEADGWVARQPHPTDRRAIVVALTPAAASTYGKLEQHYRGLAALLMSELEAADLERALKVIDQIQARLDEVSSQVEATFEPVPALPRKEMANDRQAGPA